MAKRVNWRDWTLIDDATRRSDEQRGVHGGWVEEGCGGGLRRSVLDALG